MPLSLLESRTCARPRLELQCQLATSSPRRRLYPRFEHPSASSLRSPRGPVLAGSLRPGVELPRRLVTSAHGRCGSGQQGRWGGARVSRRGEGRCTGARAGGGVGRQMAGSGCRVGGASGKLGRGSERHMRKSGFADQLRPLQERNGFFSFSSGNSFRSKKGMGFFAGVFPDRR